jgi:hypothetical protein
MHRFPSPKGAEAFVPVSLFSGCTFLFSAVTVVICRSFLK